jgi:hypothetical protein
MELTKPASAPDHPMFSAVTEHSLLQTGFRSHKSHHCQLLSQASPMCFEGIGTAPTLLALPLWRLDRASPITNALSLLLGRSLQGGRFQGCLALSRNPSTTRTRMVATPTISCGCPVSRVGLSASASSSWRSVGVGLLRAPSSSDRLS